MKKLYCPFMIDEVGYAELKYELDSAQPGDLLVITSCSGGYVDLAFDLAKTIREKELNTHLEFICASAANLLYFAGKEKTARPNARFLLHQVRFDRLFLTEITEEKLSVMKDELAQYDELFAEFIAPENKQQILELMSRNSGEGVWLKADEIDFANINTTQQQSNVLENALVARLFLQQNTQQNETQDSSCNEPEQLEFTELLKQIAELQEQVSKLEKENESLRLKNSIVKTNVIEKQLKTNVISEFAKKFQ